MKITVFFRSYEHSNGIVSSTRDELERRHQKGDLSYLNIDFINLDKRNYKKYLENAKKENSLPQIIYIWYDEEVVGEYLAETYPNIKVYHFNTTCIKKEDRHWGYGRSYHLLDEIINSFKKELKKETYIIANIKNTTIEVKSMDDITLHEELRRCYGTKIVKNIDEAIALFKSTKEKEIVELNNSISCLENELKTKKTYLRMAEKEIAKIDSLKEKFQKQYEKEIAKIK